MIVTDPLLRVELVNLYSELVRAIKEAAPPPTANTMEALESWRAGREKVSRIRRRIAEITGEQAQYGR